MRFLSSLVARFAPLLHLATSSNHKFHFGHTVASTRLDHPTVAIFNASFAEMCRIGLYKNAFPLSFPLYRKSVLERNSPL